MLRRGHRLTYLLLRAVRVAVRQRLRREPREAPAAFVGRLGAVVARRLPLVLPGAVPALLAVQEGTLPVAESSDLAVGV